MDKNGAADASTYDRIAEALIYLADHAEQQPSLQQLADHVGLSRTHLQRIFGRWVGISPKRFVQFLTINHARSLLDESRSVLDTTFDAGLSSPGRLHDLFVSIDAVSPGEYKGRGAGLEIHYGVQSSPFGACLIGSTARGVCWMSFHDDRDAQEGLDQLAKTWSQAALIRSDTSSAQWRDRIFAPSKSGVRRLPLLLRGTNFQLKVWEALVRVPPGFVCSYGDLARWIGMPTAARAAATAVAANPIAYLIPCHRVIRSVGGMGGYRWGPGRKRAMIGWELATAREEIEP